MSDLEKELAILDDRLDVMTLDRNIWKARAEEAEAKAKGSERFPIMVQEKKMPEKQNYFDFSTLTSYQIKMLLLSLEVESKTNPGQWMSPCFTFESTENFRIREIKNV